MRRWIRNHSIAYSSLKSSLIPPYISPILEGLSEQECLTYLETAYQNLGWNVKNLHSSEPSHEKGADLRLERNGTVHLVAVKVRPRQKDIPQLEMLADRDDCDARSYIYLQAPTEPFRKRAEQLEDRVKFLGPQELHQTLVQGESIPYILRIFESHPLLDDIASAMGYLWSSRKAVREVIPMTPREYEMLWDLKDATLKLRSTLSLLSLQWDNELMNQASIDPERLLQILNRALSDLDQVRHFLGGGLVAAFESAAQEMPHALSTYWDAISKRTFWMEFTIQTEGMESQEDVQVFTRRFWVLPTSSGGSRQRGFRDDIMGLYSCIVKTFLNLAAIGGDLERAVDWTWEKRLARSG